MEQLKLFMVITLVSLVIAATVQVVKKVINEKFNQFMKEWSL